jgi:hypothetical protein
MSQHWNIQISIQKVTNSETTTNWTNRGVPDATKESRREVVKVLDLAITADSEVEAYDKAQRMLTASDPRVAVVTSDQNYIAARPIRDNPQA